MCSEKVAMYSRKGHVVIKGIYEYLAKNQGKIAR